MIITSDCLNVILATSHYLNQRWFINQMLRNIFQCKFIFSLSVLQEMHLKMSVSILSWPPAGDQGWWWGHPHRSSCAALSWWGEINWRPTLKKSIVGWVIASVLDCSHIHDWFDYILKYSVKDSIIEIEPLKESLCVQCFSIVTPSVQRKRSVWPRSGILHSSGLCLVIISPWDS